MKLWPRRLGILIAVLGLIWLNAGQRAGSMGGRCSNTGSDKLWAFLPWIPDEPQPPPEIVPVIPPGGPGDGGTPVSPPTEPVPSPEPSTLALVALGSGVIGAGWQKWRYRKIEA